MYNHPESKSSLLGDEQATPNADPTTAGLERKAQFLVLRDS